MRRILLGLAVLLPLSLGVPGFSQVTAGLAGSNQLGPLDPLANTDCSSLAAHFVVDVDAAGDYAMPPGLSGGPSSDGCASAYIVDFVSLDRRMDAFEPDPDWVSGIGASTDCVGQCRNDEGAEFSWDVYRGDIHVYRCNEPRDCANNNYSHYVGTIGSLDYSNVAILGAGPRCRLRPHSGGGRRPTPVVKGAHGVRLVVKYTVDLRADGPLGPCGQGPAVLEPPLAFTASGTVGFIKAEAVKKGGRPKAVRKPPPSD